MKRDGKPGKERRPYEKPAVRCIELALDEVVMGNCKAAGEVPKCEDEFGGQNGPYGS